MPELGSGIYEPIGGYMVNINKFVHAGYAMNELTFSCHKGLKRKAKLRCKRDALRHERVAEGGHDREMHTRHRECWGMRGCDRIEAMNTLDRFVDRYGPVEGCWYAWYEGRATWAA